MPLANVEVQLPVTASAVVVAFDEVELPSVTALSVVLPVTNSVPD